METQMSTTAAAEDTLALQTTLETGIDAAQSKDGKTAEESKRGYGKGKIR